MDTEKKQLIADTFLEFFLQNGMVNTIVSDVAKELHMSKKTIYKYFHGGKEEALYYIFYEIAKKSSLSIIQKLETINDSEEQVHQLIDHIYSTAIPYVIGNAAETKDDYLIENQIVSQAFRDVYEPIVKKTIEMGLKQNKFHVNDINILFRLIYAMISESMVMIREEKFKEIKEKTEHNIFKLLK